MKNTPNVRRKKVFFPFLVLFVLAVALSVGTTLGKYYDKFPLVDLDKGERDVFFELNPAGSPSGERPGIDEQTPTTVYQVQPGDTLSSIAEKFHTTVEALAAYNNIADPDKIQAGMILRIPPADYIVPKANTEKTPSTEPTESAPTESTETKTPEATEPNAPAGSTSESNPGADTGETPNPPESTPSASGASSEDPSNDETP